MAGGVPPTQSLTQQRLAGGLLDRYLLPKVALTVISLASLASVYLTMTTHGAPPAWALVRWLHLIALGTLAGGTMSWGFFRRRTEEADVSTVGRFTVAQQQRFRIVGGAALLAALVTAPRLLWFGRWAARADLQMLWAANGIGLAAALGLAGWLLLQPPAEERAFDVQRTRLTWGALTLALALTALLDARLPFPTRPTAWLLRPIHLIAFGLWFGGAVWNIFITVPAARDTLALPVVDELDQTLRHAGYDV